VCKDARRGLERRLAVLSLEEEEEEEEEIKSGVVH
jgi:hypothetical protein